jgi:myosin-crossreactive antigen
LLKIIEKYCGVLMAFKDSSWLISIVVAAQPHFRNQPEDMVFTEEFFIRATKIAVYTLLGLDKKIPHMYDVRTLLRALNIAYR